MALSLVAYQAELSYGASLFGILQMLAPVPTCINFLKKKSVGDMSPAPYTSAFLCCFIWTYYGILINDTAIIQVNAIGTTLQVLYVAAYYICCIQKLAVKGQMLMSIGVLVITIGYVHYEALPDVAIRRVGLLACATTVLFFTSPLSNLRHVIKVKSSESLPTLLITVSFIASLLWTLYGIALDDLFVQVPNLIGCILSGFQLVLCCIYPKSTLNYKLMPL